jgi:hypothetical protein
MANFTASSGAGGGGCLLEWSLSFDDAANTVTISATHAHFDGSQAPAPQQADVTFQLSTGQSISINLLTARLSTGQLFDGNAATMLNSGPRTRTNVKLSVTADRAKLITHSTQYLPPV